MKKKKVLKEAQVSLFLNFILIRDSNLQNNENPNNN